MPQIVPIRDLKDTAKISQLCEESKEPIFVTKNGYGNLVIMSMDVYKNMSPFNHVMGRLEKSEDDVVNGRVRDAFESLKEISAEYGL